MTQAKPDGYTLSSLNTPGYLTMQMDRKVRFDPKKVCLVARIVEDPGSFIVQSNSQFNSLKDLVAYAKANPGRSALARPASERMNISPCCNWKSPPVST